jgi:subtilisin family serine protease
MDVAGSRTAVIRAVATLGALAAFATLPVTSAAAQPAAGLTLRSAAPTGPAAVPGEIVVGFRSGVDGSERAAARSAADVHAQRNLLTRGVQLVEVDKGQGVQDAIAALEKRPDVRYAEPNWIYHATATTPNDPLFDSLWGLDNTGQVVNGQAGTADDDIDAPEAWDRSTGSASTVVAVVDSGVAPDHPDLAPNIWTNPGEIAGNSTDDDGNGKVDDVHGWDFVGNSNDPWDYNDHGTHVAGTIAARGNNGVGITGVAWQASVMPVRVLNALGSGSNAAITDGFTYAAANGAKVVNASLGGPAFSQAQADAIANHPSTLFVVAAGNGGADGIGDDNDGVTPTYPCNYTAANLICVAATDNTDTLAGFSNFGTTSVDLAAPGVDIESTRPHYTDSFTDDFETGLSKWTVQSGLWGTQNAIGTNWLVDSPGGQYANNADWAIRTASKVDVGTRADCVLKFTYGTFLAAGDLLFVESSADDTTWPALGVFGNTGGAVRSAAFELGAAGSRYYRFHLTSNASGTSDGVYIDNVRLACPGGTYGAGDYQFLNGTSMASPHVAGAAAVLFSARPLAPVAKVRAALLDGGDPVAGLSGKTVSGRRLNLNGALTTLLTKADTTTSITVDAPDPSVVGQAVTVHYGVAATGLENAPPTGTVTVSDGTDSCTGTVADGQCSIALTTVGPRSLTATYAGDDDHNASAPSAGVPHQVNAAGTAATITSDSPDPSVVGEPVTVDFTVVPAAPGAGTPTGVVTVSDGVDSCTGTVATGSCDVTPTRTGNRTLTAAYAGDASFTGSASGAESHTVNVATTTAISSDGPDPSVVGQSVTVAYSVSAVGASVTLTGSVTVSDGVDSCTGTVALGRCTIRFRNAGARTLTATYAGSGNFNGSTSPGRAHAVGRAATTTTITADSPDPSTRGAAVTVRYSVAVNRPGAGTPTGNVTVGDGVNRCTASVAAGRCTLVLTAAGRRALTAGYAGDGRFRASTSGGAPHTVTQPSPSLAHVSGARATHRRFRVSAKPRLAQTSRRRPRVGTTFTYSLDRPATVRLDFTRPRAGRKVNGSCVPRRRSNRHKPKCALLRGSLTVAGHANLNSVRFKGWLSRTKKLRPGRYALVITAITPGVGATSQKLGFRIVR